MRIGIDGGCLSNRRGFGRFAGKVVEALAVEDSTHDFVVFVDRPSLESVNVPQRFETVVVDVGDAPSRAAKAGGRRGLGDVLAMGRSVAKQKLDVMYFPASYSFFPVWNAGRVIVTLHDTLALAHPELVFPNGRGRLAWKLKEYAAVWSADEIMTVSHASKRDLVAWFHLNPDRVSVLSEGADSIFERRPSSDESDRSLKRYGVSTDRRFLLYVGGLSPHKNIARLIEAFGRIEDESVDLIVVGDFSDVFHTNTKELRAMVDRLRLDRRVLFTGYVPDEDLCSLYRRSYALVQPSLMEGFGLPALEALTCGTPVLSSTAGSLPEVVGNAGKYFDPTDVQAIAGTLKSLLDDPSERARLSALAEVRAKRYSWASAAKTLLKSFERTRSTRGNAA